ncbi:secretory phospholipase A2 receptor-like [Mercenaria mercenaria]|uniref:secretory phospholipase A2 receptor-like n=1 Tax=Mercenaria mercenaria TaxID=6596 RepID=UPI00234F4A4E|nr:secretory phospholipase A2 receptor-like [Mercenaria mercenaria]
MVSVNDTNFWIGAKTHRNGSHIYYWPGGENVVYSHWGGAIAGQPDDRRLGNQNCVFLNNRDRYFWHDDECSELKTGFICEIWNVTSGQKHSKCISKVFEGYTYDPFNDFCVKLHFDDHIHHYTQAMAKDACKKDGASLVTLDNESKMDYILQNIFSNRQNATDYWIGAEDIHNNSEFYWSTGQKIAYSHWGGPAWADNLTQPDELYGAINRRCVYLNHEHNYTWFDRDCSSHLTGYICQYFGNNSGEVSLTDCTSRLSKGYSYDSSSNFCISIHKGENVTRSQARQRCSMDKSTDLVVIDNNQKMDYISKLLGDSAADFWIGGLDTFHNATFYWEPVNKVFNYTNWFTGIQPLPSDCAFLDYQNKYFWSTTSCSRPINGYICQISEKSIKSPACDTSGGYKNIAANENYVMCVKLHTESVHRSEAQQICAGEGAVLISLDTDEKLHQLRYFLSQNNSTRHQSLVTWTGGRRNGTNFYYPNGVISPLPLFCAKHLGTCECTYTSISKQLNMHAHTIKCNNSKSHSFMCERTFAHGAMA